MWQTTVLFILQLPALLLVKDFIIEVIQTTKLLPPLDSKKIKPVFNMGDFDYCLLEYFSTYVCLIIWYTIGYYRYGLEFSLFNTFIDPAIYTLVIVGYCYILNLCLTSVTTHFNSQGKNETAISLIKSGIRLTKGLIGLIMSYYLVTFAA